MTRTILTKPQSSASGIPGTIITGISVPSTLGSNILVVDSVPTALNTSIKWIYTIKSTALDKIVSAEVVAVYRPATGTVTNSRFSVVGDTIDLKHSIEVKIISNEIVLEISNLTDSLPTPTDFITNIVRIQSLS